MVFNTEPSGKSPSETVWKTFKIYLAGVWTKHFSITVYHGRTLTIELKGKRALPPAEPAGKSNQSKSKSTVCSVLMKQMVAPTMLTSWGAAIVVFKQTVASVAGQHTQLTFGHEDSSDRLMSGIELLCKVSAATIGGSKENSFSQLLW